MPDNWGYVFSAYGVAALALLVYWRRLAGRAKTLVERGKRRGFVYPGHPTQRLEGEVLAQYRRGQHQRAPVGVETSQSAANQLLNAGRQVSAGSVGPAGIGSGQRSVEGIGL